MAVIQLKDIMKTYIMGDSIVHALDHVNVSIDLANLPLSWALPGVVNPR